MSDTPDVWQCVRSIDDDRLLRLELARSPATRAARAARSFATSMKKFMPMPKKNERRPREVVDGEAAGERGAHVLEAVGEVNASSCTAVAPASCMW